MKNIFKPILFSTPMVQAIQKGTKTQTRRTKGLESVNKNPDVYEYKGYAVESRHSNLTADLKKYHFFSRESTEGNMNKVVTCPYSVGDIIWVRETFTKIKSHETGLMYYLPKASFEYYQDKIIQGEKVKWKPSIFMPRAACRIFLKVTNIRAERLLSISREDAMKEGVAFQRQPHCDEYKDYTIKEKEFSFSNPNHTFPDVPTLSFFTLWESINGSESLALNPWVWVIEFEKVERPNDFIV